MAMITNIFTTRYLGKLLDFVEGETFKVLGIKDEVNKFQRRWELISGFLPDAEQKRHKNDGINRWLRELKDVMYEADDIFDRCMFDGGRLLRVDPSASSTVCLPFNLVSSCFQCTRHRHEIANRIGGLNDRLKQIADDSVITTQLAKYTDEGHQEHRIIRSDETSPIQVEEDIVGIQIEDDAEKLVGLILKHDKRKCVMFGIVGMGGIGKTTLARKIFNDKRIKEENFPKRVWLSVSKNYSVTWLLREIIRQVGGNDDGAQSRAELESKNYSETGLLGKVVRGAGGNDDGAQSRAELETKIASLQLTTLFLVLDNVWSSDVWERILRNPILCGVASCKILVTTRDETVARSMEASHVMIHHVSKMDEDSGWKLLRKKVFGDEEENMFRDPELERVGIEIVKKCDGLPLAIKVMAGVLRGKERTRGEWLRVLGSDTWRMNQINDELPWALYLSYEDLPSHLKPCFLSCALYNGISHYADLVRLWVAEGFIVEEGGRLMEEVGEDYYKELISRNLLQLNPRYLDGTRYTVHDLLRSLGANLMEGEGITISYGQRLNKNPSMKIRRLSISSNEEILRLRNEIGEEKCLRVLHLFKSPETKIIVNGVFERCGSLRVLNLSDTSIESLPDSIGKLIHLRYLNLEGTDISEVPESIGRLANLQTLNTSWCKSLHELPKAITRLHNLRCLRLLGTPLTHVPKGIGELTNLNTLEGFVAWHDDLMRSKLGCDLDELQSLSNMRRLVICRLERANSTGASVLATKSLLELLWLEWTGQEDEQHQGAAYSEEAINRAVKICDQLTPPSSLVDLRILNYPGLQFPDWMMMMSTTSNGASNFPDLAYVNLIGLRLCTELPPLGQLRQLKYLKIRRAGAIKTIGPQFLGSAAFPKLEYLQFTDMPNWEEWLLCVAEEEEVGDAKKQIKLLPNLRTCVLWHCPMLRALPAELCHATNLKEVILERTNNLREICNLACLTDELAVRKNERLGRISNLPSLRYLQIEDCPSLEYVENVGTLQHLDLICPSTAEHLPQWLPRLIEQHCGASSLPRPSLKKVRLRCSLSIVKSCLKGNDNWQIIQQISNVEIRTLDGDEFILYTKDPYEYDTNVGSN